MTTYTWTTQLPVFYQVSVEAPDGLSPEQVWELHEKGEVELELEECDAWSSSDIRRMTTTETFKLDAMRMEVA